MQPETTIPLMQALVTLLDLLVLSSVDWLLMLLGGEWTPHYPTAADWSAVSAGGYYHHAKAFWTVLVREDAEWWTKFGRFAIWWLTIGRWILRRVI